MNMPIKDFITAVQAAELFGYTVQHTRLLARRGQIPATKVGRDWLIDRQAAVDRQSAMSAPVAVPIVRSEKAPPHGVNPGRAPGARVNPRTFAILKSPAIFSDLDIRHVAELARLAQTRRLRAGQPLFLEGDPVEQCYVVAGGLVKMLKHTLSGKAFISDLHGQGETIGFTRLFDGKQHFSSAEAIVDTEVLVIARADFISFLHRFPQTGFKVLIKMIEMASNRRKSATVRLSEQSAEPADYRLARVLTMLRYKLGPAIPLTRSEIAAMAGTTTETAARFVSRLNRDGVVRSFREKIIVVDEHKLRQRARIPEEVQKVSGQ